jgi:hypothetical protein
MSLRSAVRGLALASLSAVAVMALAAAISPQLRRRALSLAGRSPEPEAQQPTHIVLPDRVAAAWEGLEEAIEEGREVGSADIALAGA